MLQEEKDQLKAKLAEVERQIANCKHSWNEAKFDPEIVREAYGYEMKAQGSDIYYEPKGYHDVQKDRWSRKCKVCGVVEYTYTQEVVSVKKEPKF